MKVEITRHGAIAAMTIDGRLSSAVADAFEDRLRGVLDDGAAQVVIDMSALTFISSSGLRALIVAAKRLSEGGGRIHLFGLGAPIREVFEVSGLLRIFPVHATRDEAMGAAD